MKRGTRASLLVAVAAACLLGPLARAEDGATGQETCKVEDAGEVPVAIQSDPPGAILRLMQDGRTVARGRTPFVRLVAPGRYEVVVDAGRGEPQKRTLEARAGDAVAMVVRFPR